MGVSNNKATVKMLNNVSSATASIILKCKKFNTEKFPQ